MSSEDPYIQEIQANPILSIASKNQYIDKLKTAKRITRKSLDWIIENPNQTFKRIKEFYSKPQSIGAILTAILALFKHIPKFKELKDTKPRFYATYRNFYEKVFEDIDDKYRSGEASDRQKKGFVNWLTIIEERERLGKTNYASKEHVLLSMYTYLKPVRQDFYNLRIINQMPETKDEQEQGNYIVLGMKANDSSYLILNDFKTSNAFKHYKKELCRELVDIIKQSLVISPRLYLFVDSNGKPYKMENSYIKQINRILLNIFGKPLTVSLLRHSYTTYERTLNLTAGEEEDAAKEMMHSERMHNRYRLKLV